MGHAEVRWNCPLGPELVADADAIERPVTYCVSVKFTSTCVSTSTGWPFKNVGL